LGRSIDFSDAMIFAMAVVNNHGACYFLTADPSNREMKSYFARALNSGEIKKAFVCE